jgi:oxalate---CoA ligase
MRIFDDLIDIREIGRSDNFFELGGHSLLLPRLVDRIHRDFGISLPLGVIFEAPTVQGLAAIVQARSAAPSWRSLVAIREGGRRLPVYLVHGLGGEIGYFYNLVEYLHPEQPVYGLQPPAEPFTDLERMASRYLEEIRTAQPRGPYLLGGYCLGGCVAYEMARQLSEAGESVRLLAIIDSASPGTQPATPSILRRVRRLASRSPGEIVSTIAHRLTRPSTQKAVSRSPGGTDEALEWFGVPRAFHAVATRHFRAVQRYAPGPYPGDAWLFRSEDERFAHDLGWGRLIGGRVRIEMVPGRHSDVLKQPNLPHTARRLAAALEAAAGSS